MPALMLAVRHCEQREVYCSENEYPMEQKNGLYVFGIIVMIKESCATVILGMGF